MATRNFRLWVGHCCSFSHYVCLALFATPWDCSALGFPVSLSLGVCSGLMSIEEVTITTKTFRIIWAGTELLWFGESVESGKGGEKKKIKQDQDRNSLRWVRIQSTGVAGAAHGSLIRWKLTAGPEGCLLSNMRTQPQLPVCLSPGWRTSSSIQSFLNTSKQPTI